MERDDEQVLRHSVREMAQFIVVFYDELVKAGVPKRVAEKITVSQWGSMIASNQAAELTKQLLSQLDEDNGSA